MAICFVEADTAGFDKEKYLRILISIAKADRKNGPPEYMYIRRQAARLGIDYDGILQTTDKSYSIERHAVSRLTALTILKDAIALASMDQNYTLFEKEKIYTYAGKMGIPVKDVKQLEALLEEYKSLENKWNRLVSS